MAWSIQIARVLGIPIRLHLTFLLLLGWIAFEGISSGKPLLVVVALGLFTSVILHELGHSIVAQRLGINVLDITLLPIGGLARMERIPRDPAQELKIAAAGPAVNVVLTVVLWGAHLLFEPRASVPAELGSSQQILAQLAAMNLLLALFNLIPAFPMDGGRILRAVLAQRMPYARATGIAAGLGQALSFGLGFWGLVSGNPFLVLIAIFTFLGAAEEGVRVHTQEIIQGVLVRDAMMTRFATLNRGDSLGKAADLLLSGPQQDFPVIEGETLVGILSRRRLLEALAQGGRDLYLSEVMEPPPPPVSPDEPLQVAMERMSGEGVSVMPVQEGDTLCGLLTSENTSELIMVRAALSGRGHSARQPNK